MKEEYSQPPVLFIIYNRFDTTKKVFDVLKEEKPSKLFIAADGPKYEIPYEQEICDTIKHWVLENIDWDCEVKTLFREQNLGCGYGPATAISWFFENVDEGIILEDDCVPEISFFKYCAVLLEKFRYDNRIAIISGSNFDRMNTFIPGTSSYFFSVFPFTWGWATWKRNWDKFDYFIKKWGEIDKNEFLKYLFKEAEFQKAWRIVFDEIYLKTPIDIWDYQFFFSCFLQKQLSIVPSVNLISNIGHGNEATHTTYVLHEFENVPSATMNFPLVHPSVVKRNLDYDRYLQKINYGRVDNPTFMKKIKRWVKEILKYKVKS